MKPINLRIAKELGVREQQVAAAVVARRRCLPLVARSPEENIEMRDVVHRFRRGDA